MNSNAGHSRDLRNFDQTNKGHSLSAQEGRRRGGNTSNIPFLRLSHSTLQQPSQTSPNRLFLLAFGAASALYLHLSRNAQNLTGDYHLPSGRIAPFLPRAPPPPLCQSRLHPNHYPVSLPRRNPTTAKIIVSQSCFSKKPLPVFQRLPSLLCPETSTAVLLRRDMYITRCQRYISCPPRPFPSSVIRLFRIMTDPNMPSHLRPQFLNGHVPHSGTR